MNIKKLVIASVVSLFLLGCEQYPEPAVNTGERINLQAIYSVNQKDIDKIAKVLKVNYRVINVLPIEQCNQKRENNKKSCVNAELSFTAKQEIAAKDWSIYFSHLMPIQSAVSNDFDLKPLKGDLHKVILKNTFSGFSIDETKVITFKTQLDSISDVMPNFIISAPYLQPRVIKNTIPVNDINTGLEVLPHVEAANEASLLSNKNILSPQSLYQRNKSQEIDETALLHAIIPTPKSILIDANFGFADLSQGINFSLGNVFHQDVDAAIARLATLGVKHNMNGLPLHLSIVHDASKAKGSYRLTVTTKELTLVAVDGVGAFNGLQSLASLISVNDTRLAVMTVEDEPDLQYRGLMIDVASNFHSKELILSLLEQMAAYKLNKLQLHLGNDEGWRIEIPSLPELTDIGAQRCLDLNEDVCLLPMLGAGNNQRSQVNGYYSIEDYQEILTAAKARHIDVIPSFNIPSHSRAAIKAMTARQNKYLLLGEKDKAKRFLLEDPKRSSKAENTPETFSNGYDDNIIDVCLDSSYDFISLVISQLKQVYISSGQSLSTVNLGLEAQQTELLITSQCKHFSDANELTEGKGVTEYFTARVAPIFEKYGVEVMMLKTAAENKSNIFSVDFNHFEELAGEVYKGKFIGVQGLLWSDKLRTDNMVEHRLFPRLIVLANKAWRRPDGQQDSKKYKNNFAHFIGEKELAKLELADIDYRLPNVGAVIVNGVLYANVELPSLPIQYQSNNGAWLDYHKPIKVSGSVKVRSRSHDGVRVGRQSKVN